MLSVGPGARRLSPSQNIRVKSEPADSVMYITDRSSCRAHSQKRWVETSSVIRRYAGTLLTAAYGFA